MELRIPEGKPEDQVERWRATIRFLERVAKAEGINVAAVQLHNHPIGSRACYDGEADFDESVIALCSGQDRETVLHELAHLQTQTWHKRSWAQALFRLHARWLSPRKCAKADRALARDYPKARRVYRAKYGKRLRVWQRREAI